MLDDAQYVQNLDRSNALGVIAGQTGQLKQTYEFTAPKIDKIENIVVAGMGGSALGAEFLRSYAGDKLPVPLVIVRDYELPKFVGPNTLVICSSYSGNTEETLAALESAKTAGAVIAIQCAGGKLKEAALAEGYPYLELPSGFQPRMAVLYQVKALAMLLESVGVLKGVSAELEAAADWVMHHLGRWTADVPTADNLAKQIAEHINGKAAVIYGGPTLALPTMKWKIDLNENAKSAAFYYLLPEFSHNEFQGWLNAPKEALAVIELQSNLDVPHINKRFEVSNRLLSGKMPKPTIVEVQGETKLEQMIWSVMLGGFVSAYVAFLHNTDPSPVDLVERLKKELA